ncbi:MAG TPA: serine/threonine-protein kinase [Polyangiaceae bacterium]|nr:serine/threonine-protein kinase [Polyangiaceae bacterium]
MPLNPYAQSLSVPAGARGPRARQPSSAGLPAIGDVVLGGKYRIEEELGAGGMGVVMGAEHVALVQKVALKFLAPGETDGMARFLREARATARIDSEYVARVSDVGSLESGVAYMVMERLYGEDIGTYVRRAGPRPIDEAVHYILQACDGIAAAHAAGIVHRDLKPSNLFLARRADGTSTIKVLDFGISKLFGTDPRDGVGLTRSGVVLGSPRYMSPEQVRGPKNVDTRTDVWGLGLVLYELLTGEPMYGPDPLPALCLAIVSEPPRPLRAKRPDAPAALEALLLRCLEKAPARRFQSVVELALALAPFAPPEAAPILAQIAGRGGSSTASLSTGPRPASEPGDEGGASASMPVSSTPASATPRPKAQGRRSRTPLLVAAFALAAACSSALALRTGRDAHPPPSAATPLALATARPVAPPPASPPPPVVSVDDLPAAPAPAPTVVPIDPPVAPAEAAPAPAPPAPARPAPSAKRPARAGDTIDDLNNDALLNRR